MIRPSAGGVARVTRSTALVLLAVVSAACGASQVSPAPATTAAGPTASAPASPTLAASPPAVTASPGGLAGVPAGIMVDIGGRSLYVSCIGESTAGEPTVVFENGLGSSRSSWSAIQTAVSGTVRACAYDRAGMGPSDRADSEPRTAQDLADDLGLLLDRAGTHAPYVLVGHSIGPWVTTLFTVAHPDAVVGQVLVDPRGPDVSDAWAAALPPATQGEPEALTGMRDDLTALLGDPSANPERLDLPASEAQVREALATEVPPFGDMPVIVLQAGLTLMQSSDLPEPVRAAWDDAWLDGQSALASASTAGRVVVLARSGHNVQDYAPTAVVDAILEVLDGR
jgi:pimeloyl-ACP methyl ester carboxylesterase